MRTPQATALLASALLCAANGCMSPSVHRSAMRLDAAGARLITHGTSSVYVVDLSGNEGFGDEELQAVAVHLDEVRCRVLILDQTSVTDASAGLIGNMGQLEEISLGKTGFTISGIREVIRISRSLKHVIVSSDQVPIGFVARGGRGTLQVRISGRYDNQSVSLDRRVFCVTDGTAGKRLGGPSTRGTP